MNGRRTGLFELMPSVYRIRDAAWGNVLQGLLDLIDGEMHAFEDHIERLYGNWFVETAEEWVIPYIGDLLDTGVLRPSPIVSQRAWVANTLHYRRSKGTAAVLEEISRDVSGWPARAREYFELLAWNQNLNHLRMQSPGLADLRDAVQLGLVGGPFDQTPRMVDVRPIAWDPGKYNIPNVGIHVYRLVPYTLQDVDARQTADGWTVHPAGIETPLLNPGRTKTDTVHLAEETDLPVLLRLEALRTEVEAMRNSQAANVSLPPAEWFGPEPVIEIQTVDAGGTPTPIDPVEVLICDLSVRPLPGLAAGRPRPPAHVAYYPPPPGTPSVDEPIALALDPTRGAVTFPSGQDPHGMRVSYTYGFSGDLGGGPYDRTVSVNQWLTREVTFQVGVQRNPDPADTDLVGNFNDAVKKWNDYLTGGALDKSPFGVIAIVDNGTYPLDPSQWDATGIVVPPNGGLLVVAAQWPMEPTDAGEAHIKGHLVPIDVRPHLLGDLPVIGKSPAKDTPPGAFGLDGLLLEGSVVLSPDDLGGLHVAHSTLLGHPGARAGSTHGILCSKGNTDLSVDIERSIVMGLSLVSTGKLQITDSILDMAPGGGASIDAAAAPASLESVTAFGTVDVRRLEASNCIFSEAANAVLRQQGCVRYCYLADGSQVPRRYRCQPDEAVKNLSDDAVKRSETLRVRPSFASIRYGSSAYAQLHATAALEIREGAEDGAEMGAFRFLCQPQRRSNLTAQVREYLPLGLEAGILEET